MVIDRAPDGYADFMEVDADVMTSPVNLMSFYGCPSPPSEHIISAGYQSPWSSNSDSDNSWSNAGSPPHSGSQLAGFNVSEASVGSPRSSSRYQGVRVKNTVKELIMMKRLGKESQVQKQPVENECPALTSILQATKRTAVHMPHCFHKKPPAAAHNNVLSQYTQDTSLPLDRDIYTNSIMPNTVENATGSLSIESVTVRGSSFEICTPPPEQDLLSLCAKAATSPFQTNCPLLQTVERPYEAPLQSMTSQPVSLSTNTPSLPVSFFQWQIQQEEEKLAGLTQVELTSRDADGDTYLHIAVAQGRRALAYVLAKKMAEVNMLDIKEHNHQSAFQVSVAANQHLIAQDLLSLGAQVNTADCWGRTPLHVCAEKGHSLTLQAIQKYIQCDGGHVNVEAINYEGLTALHVAVLSHNAVVQELSRVGEPRSPQMVALVQRRKLLGDCISTLLVIGASYGAKDRKSGRTALHMAAEEANVELLRLFLDQPNSLSVINVKAYNGNTALHVASALQGRMAQVDAVKLLMRRGADPSSKNLENEQPAQLVPEGPVGDQVRRILKGRGAHVRVYAV